MKPIEFNRLIYEKRKKYFAEWYKYSKMIKEEALKLLSNVKVYVFGSVVEGEAHPLLSDIDVIIISDNMPNGHVERAKIKAKILEKVGPMNPFEIHLVNSEEFKWYKQFISKYVEIEK